MEIIISNDRTSDFGKALLDSIQQLPQRNNKLLIQVYNFTNEYPTVSEQLEALKEPDMENDLYYQLRDTLGWYKVASLLEEHVGKPVLARAGFVINPVSQDEIPDDRSVDIMFTHDTREFVIDKPKRGVIDGNVALNIQAGSFYIGLNNQTVHLSGEADVTLSHVKAVASGHAQLELSDGCMVQATDDVKIKREDGCNYVEVTGGQVQVEGDYTYIVIKGGAPTVEANWGSIVVAQTPADAVEQPKLKLGSDVVLIATAQLPSTDIAPTVHQIHVVPQDGVMERMIETFKSSMKDYMNPAASSARLTSLNQVKQYLIQLLPNRPDFCNQVKQVNQQEQLVRLLPNYLPDLTKAGLTSRFLKSNFDTGLLEQNGIFMYPDSYFNHQDRDTRHIFGPGLFPISNHTETMHTYEGAIVTTGSVYQVHTHGDSLVLATKVIRAQTEDQSSLIADSVRTLQMKDGSIAAIPVVREATLSGFSSLLCEQLDKLAGTEKSVTCFRNKATEAPEAYVGPVYETDPKHPDRLYDLHTQTGYYATPDMLFKDNQEGYQTTKQTEQKGKIGRSL